MLKLNSFIGRQRAWALCALFMVCLGLIAASSRPESSAQEAPRPAKAPDADTFGPQPADLSVTVFGQSPGEGFEAMAPQPAFPAAASFSFTGRRSTAVESALQAYRAAKDDTARDKAMEELHKQLGVEYDQTLVTHEKALDQMEARLTALREQISRRRSAKSRMVELRIQTLVSEAEGLGWPAKARQEVEGFPLDVRAPGLDGE